MILTVKDTRTLRGRKGTDSGLTSLQKSVSTCRETHTRGPTVHSTDQVRNRKETSLSHTMKTMRECHSQRETGTTLTSTASGTSMKEAKARTGQRVSVDSLLASSVEPVAVRDSPTRGSKAGQAHLMKAMNPCDWTRNTRTYPDSTPTVSDQSQGTQRIATGTAQQKSPLTNQTSNVSLKCPMSRKSKRSSFRPNACRT